jgi:hypothetical protein
MKNLFFAKLKSIEPKLKGEERQLFRLLTLEFIKDYYQITPGKSIRKPI